MSERGGERERERGRRERGRERWSNNEDENVHVVYNPGCVNQLLQATVMWSEL